MQSIVGSMEDSGPYSKSKGIRVGSKCRDSRATRRSRVVKEHGVRSQTVWTQIPGQTLTTHVTKVQVS